MNPLLFVMSVMLVILAIIMILSYYDQREMDRIEKLRKRGIRTQGIVIGNKRYGGDSVGFNPIIGFETHEGNFIEVEDKVVAQASQTGFVEGVSIRLSYDKENPRNFLVLTPENYRRTPKTPWYLQKKR